MAKTSTNDLPIGRIAGLFGIRGELKCDPTSAGRTLFSRGSTLRCELAGASEMVTIASVREHKGRLLLRIDGVESATAAERYIAARFFAPREAIELDDGEYLDIDLIGCEVVSVDGNAHGRVERVEHYPTNDMLIVDGRMLPMVRAFIRGIDIQAKRVTVDVPPGLLDDAAEDGDS